MDNDRIVSYVINDFLKFERKIYSIFNIPLGRVIYFKTLIYLGGLGTFFLFLSILPLFNLLPIPFYLGLAIIGAWILTDQGTENRPPLNAFASLVRFHYQKFRGETFYKGRVLPKQKTIKFERLPEIRESREQQPKKKEKFLVFKKGVIIK